MRTPTIILALVAALLATPVHSAQTPAAAQSTKPLMQVAIDQLSPDQIATFGLTRFSFAAGTSLQVETGSGPALYYVESGAITVTARTGASPVLAPAWTGEGVATPEAPSGDEVDARGGDGFLLAANTTADVRNDGVDPTTILAVITAPELTAQATGHVAQALLVGTNVTLPESPIVVTLSQTTLAAGKRLELPAPPALVAYAAVERGEAFLLSGQGINRSTEPLEAYVLVIARETDS